MHFVAALDSAPRMRDVPGLSEGVVIGAADGYARIADKPAATLLHLSPVLAGPAAVGLWHSPVPRRAGRWPSMWRRFSGVCVALAGSRQS
ncbi:hypothetical protein [Streptomyces sp. NBC_01520]|uniref:hypothetical protein n=1 Tax=Streptomyces sp. NBC_01520 TaxID=2903892 RepID=UPI00386E670C